MRKINVSTPVYADGYVYASSGYGLGGVALKLSASMFGTPTISMRTRSRRSDQL